MILIHDRSSNLAKTYKKKGSVIEITETRVYDESISVLEAERQGCLNTIESMEERIAEIDKMLASEEMLASKEMLASE